MPDSILAPNWWLGVLDQKYWPMRKMPFVYEVDCNPVLVAGNVQQFSIDIQQDSDFVCLWVSALVTSTAAVPVLIWGSGFTNNSLSFTLVQIVDVTTQQNLQSTQVPLDNIAGSGPFQAQTPWPYTFKAAGKILVNLVNQNNAQTVVRLSFGGVRVFLPA